MIDLTEKERQPNTPNTHLAVTVRAGTPSKPTRLGDFDIFEAVGHGGMGTVYRARQRSLERIVALKVLNTQISASQKSVDRFQREAQAAAKLHHQHIIPIFARGSEEGVYYYAMEMINGPSLFELIYHRQGPGPTGQSTVDLAETVALPRSPVVRSGDGKTDSSTVVPAPSDAGDSASARLGDTVAECYATIAMHMANIADALDYAHGQGVIHRDIKPHNLMLNADSRMMISDFGLARLIEQPGVTMTGEMVGSPLYMSPEQISGGSSGVDARSDIYSLGATMYEWLTAQPPFPGDTREQVIGLILGSEPKPLRSINPTIPVALETICQKAIDRDPQRRYQTAAEFRDDLRRFVESRPIWAKRASMPTRVARFVARRHTAFIAILAIAAAVFLTGALLIQRDRFKAEEATTSQLRKEHEQVVGLISLLSSKRDGSLSLGGSAAPLVESIMATGQMIGQQFIDTENNEGANPAVAGTPLGIAARTADDFYTEMRSSFPPKPVSPDDANGVFLRQATSAFDKSEYNDALTLVKTFIAAQPDHVGALQLQAMLFVRLGQSDKVASVAERLIELRRDDPIGYTWLALGKLLSADYEGAIEATEGWSAAREQSSWARLVRALAMVALQRSHEAIPMLTDLLAAKPDNVIGLLTRATAYGAQVEMDNAIADISRAIELEPENADAIACRGQYHAGMGHFEEAIGDFDRAMELGGRNTLLAGQRLLATSGRDNENATARSKGQDPIKSDGGDEASPVQNEDLQNHFMQFVWPQSPHDHHDTEPVPVSP